MPVMMIEKYEQAIPDNKMQPIRQSPLVSVLVRCHQGKSNFVLFVDSTAVFDAQHGSTCPVVVDRVGHQQFPRF